MQDQGQDTVILSLLRERIATKRRRAALKIELRAAGKSLYDIGSALKHASPGRIASKIEYLLPKLRSVQGIWELAEVRARLEELKKVEARLADLDQIAAGMGID